MKFLVLAPFLVVTAFAYPDVSELNGYNYNRPSGGNNLGSANQPSGSYLPGSSSNNFHQATQPSSSYIPASGSNNFGHSTSPSGSYIPPSGSNNYNQVSSPSGSYLPGGASGHDPNQIQEQKHVYFYAAPDDEEQAHLKINVAANNHKSTKIIFIKTPSSGPVVPEIISPPSSAEDKTLVYVLVKKQDQGGAITIPSSVGVKQAKPEVYFIKYKNQHDAEKAVSESVGGHSAGSSLPALNDAQAFVRTIKDTPQNGIGDGLGGGSSLLGSAGSFSTDFGNGNGGLGGNGLGSHGLAGSGLGNNGFGNNGLGSIGLGSSGSSYNYGPPGGSGPY